MKRFVVVASTLMVAFVTYKATVGVVWKIDPSISARQLVDCKTLTLVSMDNPIERLPLTSITLKTTETGTVFATAYFVFVPYARHELVQRCTESRRFWN
jgi:hypothetical protein